MRKILFGIILLAAILGLYRWSKTNQPAGATAGGELVITQRTEPASFNRIAAPQFSALRMVKQYVEEMYAPAAEQAKSSGVAG